LTPLPRPTLPNLTTDAQEAETTLAGYSSIDHDFLQSAQIFRFAIIFSQ
jgi:hypothetical protein